MVGYFCVQKGKKENSPILIASGSHLKSDTYSSIGLIVGIVLLLVTGYHWIDSIAALVFAIIIIYTGYKIIRKAVSGMMDEIDTQIVDEIVTVLNAHRLNQWIDIHNMRVIDYAGFYHIDCHLTVPYYININEGHIILDSLTDMLKDHFQNKVEFFVHIDGCIPTQCSLCSINPCDKRSAAFTKHLVWTEENILSNEKHHL